MEAIKFYDENQAQNKLDKDFKKIVEVLKPYVDKNLGRSLDESFSQEDSDFIQKQVPEGWIFCVASNCFYVRIGDGENEEKPFFASNIRVDFKYKEAKDFGVFVKSIIKRYPIGYCNCGNEIKPMLYLLDIEKQYEKGGLNKFVAFIRSKFSIIKLRTYPYWEYQLNFNMCEKCL